MIAAVHEASFRALAAELAADAHGRTGFPFSEWALLLDQLTGVHAEAPLRRVGNEYVAAFSLAAEDSFHFNEAWTSRAATSGVAASLPHHGARDVHAETVSRPISLLDDYGDDAILVADAGNHLNAAILAFFAERAPSLELAYEP
jgi:hypothetical protein